MPLFAKAHGAHLTAEDLANHRVDWVELLSRDFAGGSVQELPPNGQGIATLIALGILEQCGIEQHHLTPCNPLHLSIEAMKLALADLDRYVADEAHMEFAAKELLSDHYLKSRAALIDPDKASDFEYGSPTQSGTVYISTADASGMMVSFIQSNYMGFGSGLWYRIPASACKTAAADLCWIRSTRTRWRAASVRSTPSFRVLRWTATASR